MIKNGKSLTDCNIDTLCGWASLIDVSDCIGDKPINDAIFRKKAKTHIKEGDIIVVLRSNLNENYPNSSEDYWNHHF